MQFQGGAPFIPRYLKSINKKISECTSDGELQRLLAKKAGYHARHSQIHEANLIVDELRQSNRNFDPRVTGWIALSEGMILHFDKLDSIQSKAWFQKALEMGNASCDIELQCISSAWLANTNFGLGEFNEVIDNLDFCLKNSSKTDDDTRGRAYLVLGDILSWAGDQKLARNFYMRARVHAVRDGDIAMQNIMLFNLSAYAIAHLTFADCKSPLPESAWQFIALEFASSTNLNTALQIHGLPTTISSLKADLYIIQRKWKEGKSILDDTMPLLEKEGQRRLLPKYFAQRAWCHAQLGDRAGALADISNAVLHISDCIDPDDLYILHSRISATHHILGLIPEALKSSQAAQAFWGQYSELQSAALGRVQPILEFLDLELKNPA